VISVNETEAMVVVFTAAIVSLTVLAIEYWYIMHQDSAVLTAISSVIGGIVGYTYKLLRDKMRSQR